MDFIVFIDYIFKIYNLKINPFVRYIPYINLKIYPFLDIRMSPAGSPSTRLKVDVMELEGGARARGAGFAEAAAPCPWGMR